jgi:hypothetical protein
MYFIIIAVDIGSLIQLLLLQLFVCYTKCLVLVMRDRIALWLSSRTPGITDGNPSVRGHLLPTAIRPHPCISHLQMEVSLKPGIQETNQQDM